MLSDEEINSYLAEMENELINSEDKKEIELSSV